MSKYYFYNEDDEKCVTLAIVKGRMAFDQITEKEVAKAKMVIGDDIFYCSHFGEVGETRQGCGKECQFYIPRNGKSGRCTKSKNCYEHGSKILIKL